MTYRYGDIILVPFPFTDQSTTKRRPAVVVSSDLYHRERRDLLILAITSQVPTTPRVCEALIREWQAAGLVKPSVVKPVMTTLEQSLVLTRLGRLREGDQEQVERLLATILGPESRPIGQDQTE